MFTRLDVVCDVYQAEISNVCILVLIVDLILDMCIKEWKSTYPLNEYPANAVS